MLIGSLIGYSGGIDNFLIVFDIRLPLLAPYGTYAIPLYVLIASYAIIRHRLMDINLAIRRTAVFAIVYALVLGLPLLSALVWQPQLERTLGSKWWVWLLVGYAVLATAAHYVNLHFQRRAEDRLLAEERKAHEALRKISQGMMRFTRLRVLVKAIVKSIVNILHLTHAAIYLHNEEKGVYECRAVRHHPPRKDSSLPDSIESDAVLPKDLATGRLPQVQEELRLQQQSVSRQWREMVEDLERLHASVVIPAFKQNKLFGFVVLGEKYSGRVWSQDDLNVLMVLANQAALAIENAQLHEAEEQRLIKEAIEQTAADISYGVSHQFNNRLNVIAILAASPVLSLTGKDLRNLPPEEAAKWLDKMYHEMKKIAEAAEMGGQISKGIMSLAKAIPENFKPIEVPPLIEQAIDFVKIKHTKEQVEGEHLDAEILNGVPKELSPLSGNPAQIHDTFMNILDNALDAIREKIYQISRGKIPAPPEPYRGRIRVQAEEKEGWITVTIQDDGIGIEKEDMRRIFQPWFTTKATGVKGRGMGGHGLGLYFIKRIIETHGGRIRTYSEHTKWTRFVVDLPIIKKEEVDHAA